jgi:hypothetical protein
VSIENKGKYGNFITSFRAWHDRGLLRENYTVKFKYRADWYSCFAFRLADDGNYDFFKYSVKTGSYVVLKSYNYGSSIDSGTRTLKAALETIVRKSYAITRMDADLATVLIYTAEAARSVVVYEHCLSKYSYKAIDFGYLRTYINNYGKARAKRKKLGKVGPLERDDYT